MAASLKRWLVAAAGVAAASYLAVMAWTGALPQNRQRVQFEARGMLALEPERVSRVSVARGGRQAVLVRSAGAGWALEGAGPLAAPLSERLSLAVQFMHTSAPVRVLEPADLRAADPGEFGLERPELAIALHADGAPVLRARFGARNPDDMLQYVAIDGRPEVLLLSRFVGLEWRAVADGVLVQ